ARDERAEVRVRRRGRGALVLAEFRRDLAGGDDVRVRVAPAQLLGRGELVARVAEREEKADRDRLGIDLRELTERLELAVGADPAGHAVTPLERHERLRMR